MNPGLDRLQPYPFQRLGTLIADATPPRIFRQSPSRSVNRDTHRRKT